MFTKFVLLKVIIGGCVGFGAAFGFNHWIGPYISSPHLLEFLDVIIALSLGAVVGYFPYPN